MPHFGIVDGKETVGDVLDLFKGLLPTTHFEQIFVINQKITLQGVHHIMRHTKLTIKERLALVTLVYHGAQQEHRGTESPCEQSPKKEEKPSVDIDHKEEQKKRNTGGSPRVSMAANSSLPFSTLRRNR